jgi:glutaredoxin
MLKRPDSKEIEIQISSMLEKVLDSDEETQTESPQIPMRNFENPKFFDDPYATDAPRLLFVGQPKFEEKFQELEDPLDSFLKKHEFRGSPQIFQTGNKNLAQLGLFMNQMQPSHNNKSNDASMTVSSKNSYERIDSRRGSQVSKNSKLSSGSGSYLNEVFEDLLENKVKLADCVDEEAHIVLQGNYFTVLCSQVGSRILQKVLPHTSPCVITMIFQEIDQMIPQLMTDSYANYFCQKFFSLLNEADRTKFLCRLRENIVEIGNSKIGTYPLQAIIDQLHSEPEKKIIIEAVREKVLCMSLNPQGTHVIEKMLNLFEEWRLQHVYEAIIRNFLFLTNNSNGLCVIKKIIAKAQNLETQMILRKILADNALTLVQNPYGNYAIQAALEVINFTFKLKFNFLFF